VSRWIAFKKVTPTRDILEPKREAEETREAIAARILMEKRYCGARNGLLGGR
jgi:hypothetical protein